LLTTPCSGSASHRPPNQCRSTGIAPNHGTPPAATPRNPALPHRSNDRDHRFQVASADLFDSYHPDDQPPAKSFRVPRVKSARRKGLTSRPLEAEAAQRPLDLGDLCSDLFELLAG